MTMRRVIVESPYRAPTYFAQRANVTYARRAVRDCVLRGEAPIASHLLFTQPDILRDTVAAERQVGMEAGHAWIEAADAIVVYTDRGISEGMQIAIDAAKAAGIPIEYRTLPALAREPP